MQSRLNLALQHLVTLGMLTEHSAKLVEAAVNNQVFHNAPDADAMHHLCQPVEPDKLTRQQAVAELDNILGPPDGRQRSFTGEQAARVRELKQLLKGLPFHDKMHRIERMLDSFGDESFEGLDETVMAVGYALHRFVALNCGDQDEVRELLVSAFNGDAVPGS